MKLAERLRTAREAKNLSQADVARMIGAATDTVAAAEQNRTIPERTTLLRFAPVLEVPYGELIALAAESKPKTRKRAARNVGILPAPRDAVPTYEARVAACNWIHINEVIELDTRKHAAIVDAGLFRVHVLGDCMEPRFHDGDVVEFRIVRLGKEPFPQGEDCIVITSDDEVTLKRMHEVTDDSITLYALNWRKYPDPIVVPRQMVTRVAVAMKVVSDPPRVAFKPVK